MIRRARRLQAFVIGYGGLLVLLLVSTAQHAAADSVLPEVYSDEWLSIRAGIDTGTDDLVELGEVLRLRVLVNFDAARVSPSSIDEGFFSSVWPAELGPSLQSWEGWSDQSDGENLDQLRAHFDFQLLTCPEQQLACPGTRRYRVPEFTLAYALSEGDDAGSRVARFQPRPTELRVETVLTLDTNDALLSFDSYFPNGAYPAPTVSDSGIVEWLAIAAVFLILLLGGIFMWSFRKRGKGDTAAQGEARWQQVLQQLGNEPEQQEARRYDALRRAVVWFCVDELQTDPYRWLNTSPTENMQEPTQEVETLHQLFIELLQNPPGRVPELQARFEAFVSRATSKA